MIRFLNEELRRQFEDPRLNPLLVMMVLYANWLAEICADRSLFVTSVYSPGDKSVHGYWRGVDADNDYIDPKIKDKIAEAVNKIFIYDPERPKYVVCLRHAVPGRGGDHFHFQVHPNTQIRGGVV